MVSDKYATIMYIAVTCSGSGISIQQINPKRSSTVQIL